MTEAPTWDLAGSVAVVTGGAGGIGRALGSRLAAEGCVVVLVDLDADCVRSAAHAIPNAVGMACDVGDRVAVQEMVDDVEAHVGPIGVYCSNAGISTHGGLGDDDDWDA